MGGVLAGLAASALPGVLDTGAQYFSAKDLARENRQWQEKMARNQYQYAAEDLAKAGLNRVLAIGSPAPTPSGGISSGIDGPFEKSARINSAKSAVSLQGSQEKLVNSQDAVARSQELVNNETVKRTKAETARVVQETATSAAQAALLREQLNKVPQETRKISNEADALTLDAMVGAKSQGLLQSIGNFFSSRGRARAAERLADKNNAFKAAQRDKDRALLKSRYVKTNEGYKPVIPNKRK